jgi:hypothetical protein
LVQTFFVTAATANPRFVGAGSFPGLSLLAHFIITDWVSSLSENDHTNESLWRARIKELEAELLKVKSELVAATEKLQLTAAVKEAFEQDQWKNAAQEQMFNLEIELAKQQAEASTLREQVIRLMRSVPRNGQLIVKPNLPLHQFTHNNNVGFVIMPFGPRWSKSVENSIQKALIECNFEYRRADKVTGRHIMLDVIWKSICECGLVVADVTDCNPNVLYELGLAEAIGKKIILISQTADPRKLAFDLLGLQLILYSKRRCNDLTKKLVKSLKGSERRASEEKTSQTNRMS